jgi:hypothetical protein
LWFLFRIKLEVIRQWRDWGIINGSGINNKALSSINLSSRPFKNDLFAHINIVYQIVVFFQLKDINSMTSIRIYSGGSALIILIVFILSQYLLSLDSPIAIHNPPTSCISVGDGKKSICAVCLNNTKILTLPGYGWKIESDQNFRIGKFK